MSLGYKYRVTQVPLLPIFTKGGSKFYFIYFYFLLLDGSGVFGSRVKTPDFVLYTQDKQWQKLRNQRHVVGQSFTIGHWPHHQLLPACRRD